MRWRRRDREPDPDLVAAEAQVANLQTRAQAVVSVLRPRHERNHWREAIEEMVYAKGGRPT